MIRGNQTANEIASEFGIHVSLVNRWKKEAIKALPSVFGNNQAQAKANEIITEMGSNLDLTLAADKNANVQR